MSVETFEVPTGLKLAIENLLKSFRGVDKTDFKVVE